MCVCFIALVIVLELLWAFVLHCQYSGQEASPWQWKPSLIKVCIHVHVHVHVCVCTYIHVCMGVHACMHVRTCY